MLKGLTSRYKNDHPYDHFGPALAFLCKFFLETIKNGKKWYLCSIKWALLSCHRKVCSHYKIPCEHIGIPFVNSWARAFLICTNIVDGYLTTLITISICIRAELSKLQVIETSSVKRNKMTTMLPSNLEQWTQGAYYRLQYAYVT